MNVSTSLTFFKLKIFNLEFASENVTNNDLILSLDESGHSEFDQWKGLNAQFLLFKLFLEIVSEDLWGQYFSLFWSHHAVLVNSFSWHYLITFFKLLCFKVRKLSESIFMDPTTLHQVLRELYQSHDVSGSDLLWWSTHFVELSKHHNLGKHNIEEWWNGSQNLF